MKKKILILFIFPIFSFAATASIQNIIGTIASILKGLIPLTIGVALLLFFWGIAKFILAAGSEEAVKDGRRLLIWGVVALFVMISIWGIVELLQNVFLGGSPIYSLPVN